MKIITKIMFLGLFGLGTWMMWPSLSQLFAGETFAIVKESEQYITSLAGFMVAAVSAIIVVAKHEAFFG